MAGLIAWSAGNLNDKQLWMTSVGRRHGSEALGHLPMGMCSRRHQGGICSRRSGRICGLEGLPQGNMAIQGFISCGISLITSLHAPGWARGRLSVRKFPYFSYGRGCPSLYPVLSSVFLDHWSNTRLACVCLSSSGHFPSVFPAPFAGHTTAGNRALLSTRAQVCGTGRVLGVWV